MLAVPVELVVIVPARELLRAGLGDEEQAVVPWHTLWAAERPKWVHACGHNQSGQRRYPDHLIYEHLILQMAHQDAAGWYECDGAWGGGLAATAHRVSKTVPLQQDNIHTFPGAYLRGG